MFHPRAQSYQRPKEVLTLESLRRVLVYVRSDNGGRKHERKEIPDSFREIFKGGSGLSKVLYCTTSRKNVRRQEKFCESSNIDPSLPFSLSIFFLSPPHRLIYFSLWTLHAYVVSTGI